MSFFEVNGLNIDAELGNFDRSDQDVQNFARSEGLTLEGTLYSPKRGWSFGTPWDPETAKATAEREWIKGRGHYWTFERVDGGTTRFNKYSSDGGPGFGTGISGSTPTKFGTWAGAIASGGFSNVTATFGSEGRYSVSVWKRESTTSWILCTAIDRGSGATYYAGLTGTGVTTAFTWMSISAASGYLGIQLQGENESGTNAAALYDGLMLLPYALTTPMLTARNGRTEAEPRFPYVALSGDFLEDTRAVVAKGFVEQEEYTQVQRNGVTNARARKVTFVEK